MNTARRHLVPLLGAFLGCGPTTFNITTTGEGEAGEASTTDISSGSTGLGGSASGHVDTTSHTGAESDGGTDCGTTTTGDGSSSSSSGEPPPECIYYPLLDLCVCDEMEVAIDGNPLGCFCGALEIDPVYCAPPVCAFNPTTSVCECDGAPDDPSKCECTEQSPGVCLCDGYQAPPEYCNWCPDLTPPQPCPPSP